MSDSTVNAHLEGIISDFEALKRSFEVEDTDTTTHPSPLSRRTTNPLRSSTSSTTSQRSYDLSSRNSDYSSSSSRSTASESSNLRSPKTGMRRIELSGRNPDAAASRRAEISIEVSSKQIDSSPSAGIARFGLKRPEVSLSSRSNALDGTSNSISSITNRRAELSMTRAQEPPAPPRRADSQLSSTPVSRIPELTQRRAEPPSPSLSLVDGVSRRPEIPVFRQPENSATGSPVENNNHPPPAPVAPLPTLAEPRVEKVQSPVAEQPTTRPTDRPEVFPSNSSSAMSEAVVPDAMVPPAVGSLYGEKAGGAMVDFSYVGIDAILEQMRRKAMKQGFELNIMVVGQSGLGKSTLMNTLFKSKVSRKSVLGTGQEKIPKTIEIKSISHDIEEKGVRMKLTVIDTPGFGDQINNENCWQPIMKFINDQYEAYLQEEININRKKRIPDSRIHCCIYFIPPTGHCLRPLDVEFMRRLSKVVNIVPVIAKADTLTLEERDFFKKKIREELRANGIDVYPQKEFDEDTEDRMINEKIREMIPFAVVGSDQEYQVNGRRLLGRKTKWGTIEVENIAHCEFAYLRDLLIRTHMQNIKDITSSIHYEMYRVRRLNENNTAVAHANGVPEHHLTAHEM
ncbi:septin 9a isoform X2 [Poecilia latipinna]|uniref:Septin-type G domain-containing protein n=1 Tax=Poecilia mexicana TaxID=48701 RepID=A0A3B3WYC2_9TELE|nr:PREDICTED: neuronal-specific septin-3-like isoform X2 [Poecilia formosa]XP_014868236.1 PREDICTED: neuronal-specific septin-3-like isoform X2 [Poecilia mexicana]XP_014915170.1 PREDICTED: neuronal-specific septin-3-like isoform X2 [Poecilia latipinna]